MPVRKAQVAPCGCPCLLHGRDPCACWCNDHGDNAMAVVA